MIQKPTYYFYYFEVEGYEVRFLQDAPITVCVIRSLTDRSQKKYTGISVCHPSDVWDEAIGRHKAMKKTLDDVIIRKNGHLMMSYLPAKAIQRAYWEHYKNVEAKMNKNE